MVALDVKDLLASLREVAAATPDLDPNDNPDDSEDPNSDPGNDDGDPNDAPRSYYPDGEGEDGEKHEDEDENDFCQPRIFNTVMLLEKRLTEEAEEKAYNDRKLAARRAGMKFMMKPKSRAEVKRSKLFELRRRNNEMRCELDMNRQLELETKRHEEAALALYRSNMTPEQKRQREEDTERMATWASGICKEARMSWREDAQAEFNSKKL